MTVPTPEAAAERNVIPDVHTFSMAQAAPQSQLSF
jgi:hypothetical protein